VEGFSTTFPLHVFLYCCELLCNQELLLRLELGTTAAIAVDLGDCKMDSELPEPKRK
jgi:hypothetical protein